MYPKDNSLTMACLLLPGCCCFQSLISVCGEGGSGEGYHYYLKIRSKEGSKQVIYSVTFPYLLRAIACQCGPKAEVIGMRH